MMRLVRRALTLCSIFSFGVLVCTPWLKSGGVQAAAPLVQAPYLSGPVVDDAGLLHESERVRLERLLRDFRARTGVQMAIYIPSSLQDNDIESFSMAIAEQWKLGRKGVDRGLLLVLAPRERQVRLEVGYGLEGTFTDAWSRRMLDEVLVPYLRDGRVEEGLAAAVGRLAAELRADLPGTPPPRERSERRMATPLWVWVLLLIFIFPVFWIIIASQSAAGTGYGPPGFPVSRRRRDGSDWGAGGFGGGGFRGGGGGFGGGGASSRW